MSLEDARANIGTCRQDYIHLRPESALSDAAPAVFASQFKGSTNGRNSEVWTVQLLEGDHNRNSSSRKYQ